MSSKQCTQLVSSASISVSSNLLDSLFKMEASPELADFIDFATGKVNVAKFSLAELEFEGKERIGPDFEVNVKRPFERRKIYVRRDPTMSFWWQDYVIDADHT